MNLIRIKVVSEDKTNNKEYIIEVTKTANLELANTNLETFAIENAFLSPPLDNHIIQYNTQVSNELTKLNILAVPENDQGNVEISGNEDLKDGNNKLIVTVTAPNGITKREYQVNVYKRNVQEEQKYKEEQEKLQEKLEQAYEIEKISMTNEENSSILEKPEKNLILVGIIIILIIAIVIGGIYYKKKFNFKKE